MIHSVSSDLPSFKGLTFKPGLNILLADKSEGATDRQSRNGAGKTSLVEFVHFLFGSSADRESIFRSDALAPWLFEARVDVAARTVEIARSGARSSRVRVRGDTSGWPDHPSIDQRTGDPSFSNKEWQSLLGRLLFHLEPSDEEEGTARFSPRFRQLFAYFARRQGSGGFLLPTQQSSKQQLWDQQVAITYLLGLDAQIPQELQEVRTQEKAMSELRKAARDGGLGRFFGAVADMRTKLTVAEARARRMAEQIAAFTVVPEYSEMEQEAAVLTRDVSNLNNRNTMDRELVLQLRDALEAEQPPAVASLERLYREAGVILPDTVGRRFSEVAAFHQAVMRNRRSHLLSEIGAAEARIVERERARKAFDVRRRQLMGILQSGGALDHYARLQEEVGRAEAEAEGYRQRLATAERIESTRAELDIDRARLFKALQDDHHERRSAITDAILAFEDLSNALYEKAGSLTIAATQNGPTVDVRIDAQRSRGITNMQIFCFDLMMTDLATRRGIGPGFLIHDSHLFDGVDARQVAKALQLGAAHSAAVGYQYIVTMNSDALPRGEFKDGFDVDAHIVPVRLTDATESGGLFGIRFN